MTEIDNSDDTIRASAGGLSRPILVPLDGTDVSEGILPYVCQIARSASLPLILHGVVDPEAIEYPASAAEHAIYKDQVEDGALAHAASRLRTIAERLDDEGVKAKIKTTLGKPADQILRVAAEEGCGLIAMSTHGKNAISRAILGSVTDSLVHTSTVPVLAIAPEKAGAYQERNGVPLERIILPLDGSPLAEQAVPHAETLAKALSLEIILVRAVNFVYPAYSYPIYAQLDSLTEDRVEEAGEYLGGVCRDLKSRGLTVRTTVLRGTPGPALLDFARRTPNNLIAMTTHGRSGMSRMLMGSVTDALIRASDDPVLVIRPQ